MDVLIKGGITLVYGVLICSVSVHSKDGPEVVIELVDGQSSNEGRVELVKGGERGTVCDHGWDDKDATVVCHMLGYKQGTARKGAYYGQGYQHFTILLEDVSCTGSESSISDCQHAGWGSSNCGHDEDAGVVCSYPTDKGLETEDIWKEMPCGSRPLESVSTRKRREVNDGFARHARRRPPLTMSIVGGFKASKGFYPWQVGVRRKYATNPLITRHRCGGTILSEYWILSAAHCFKNLHKNEIMLRTGDHDNTQPDDHEQEFEVDVLIKHPEFNGSTFDFDVALIKIKPVDGRGINFTDYVQPACLPDENTQYEKGTMCHISGWGFTKIRSAQTLLKAAKVPLIADTTCKQMYQPRQITSNMFCAGYKEGGIDSCNGDSGGPLVCDVNGRYTVMGVTSFGKGCARKKFPGVYAKVKSVLPWIKEHIGNCTVPDVGNSTIYPMHSTIPLSEGDQLLTGERMFIACEAPFSDTYKLIQCRHGVWSKRIPEQCLKPAEECKASVDQGEVGFTVTCDEGYSVNVPELSNEFIYYAGSLVTKDSDRQVKCLPKQLEAKPGYKQRMQYYDSTRAKWRRIRNSRWIISGARIKVACKAKYELFDGVYLDTPNIICKNDNGIWSPPIPECKDVPARCPVPCVPVAATLLNPLPMYWEGDVIDFVCEGNTTYDGSSRRECLRNSQWSGYPIDCFGGRSLPIVMSDVLRKLRTMSTSDGMDVYLAVDISDSMHMSGAYDIMKTFLSLLQSVSISNVTKLYVYGLSTGFATYAFTLRNEHDNGELAKDLKREIAAYQSRYYFTTNIYEHLDEIKTCLKKKQLEWKNVQQGSAVRQVLILISDGIQTEGGDTAEIANELKSDTFNLEIMSVCIPYKQRIDGMSLMKELASEPKIDHFFLIKPDREMLLNCTEEMCMSVGCTKPGLTHYKAENTVRIAEPYAWPWIAMISRPRHYCLASLIDSHWVLTSVSCVDGYEPWTISIPSHNVPNEESIQRRTTEVIYHEDYNPNFEPDVLYNIALLYTKVKITFSPDIHAVGLDLSDEHYNDLFNDSNSQYGIGYNSNFEFNQYQMEIQKSKTCANMTKQRGDGHLYNSSLMFCTRGKAVQNKRPGLYRGGPFVVPYPDDQPEKANHFIQVGVLTDAWVCEEGAMCFLYTKLTPELRTWIKTKMAEKSTDN